MGTELKKPEGGTDISQYTGRLQCYGEAEKEEG